MPSAIGIACPKEWLLFEPKFLCEKTYEIEQLTQMQLNPVLPSEQEINLCCFKSLRFCDFLSQQKLTNQVVGVLFTELTLH